MPSPTNPQRLDLIDALRGFAALWVFLYHIWNVLNPWKTSQVAPVSWDVNQSWFDSLSFFAIQFGYYGVTIFFVVSGFCIHLPQARRRVVGGQDGLKLAAFFERRFWRLYPAYFASLFVASLSLGVMRLMEYQSRGWPLPLPDGFYEQAFGVKEILYNAFFLLPFFESAKDLNSVLWTLVFEVQFYLLYPVLLIMMRRVGLLPVGLILLICEIIMVPMPKNSSNYLDHSPWDYFFLAKYFEWYLGVIAAECLVRQRRLPNRMTLLFVAVVCLAISMVSVFYSVLWPYRDVWVALATFFFLLGMLPYQKEKTNNHLFKLLVWLGLFSYSLYLLHIPLMRIMYAGNTLLAEWLGRPGWQHVLIYDCIPIVIFTSWVFYLCFEKPYLKQR
ncbi:MAG: acyltransferase [Planctomycetia bacterium]|nr:acyltransferase [Planctomycetia bacterium]